MRQPRTRTTITTITITVIITMIMAITMTTLTGMRMAMNTVTSTTTGMTTGMTTATTTTMTTGTTTGMGVTITTALPIAMAEDGLKHPEGYEFWRDPRWWRAWAVEGIGPMFFVFLAIAVASGAAVWWLYGAEVFTAALVSDAWMLAETLPRVIVAVGTAGLLWAILPREKIAGLIDRASGFRGLLVACAAGALTPGGPSSAFVLLALIGSMGADRGVMVTYITAWATLGLQRILTWDMPLMGADFTALRFAATLPLPVLAGMLARALPIEVVLKREVRLRDRL